MRRCWITLGAETGVDDRDGGEVLWVRVNLTSLDLRFDLPDPAPHKAIVKMGFENPMVLRFAYLSPCGPS